METSTGAATSICGNEMSRTPLSLGGSVSTLKLGGGVSDGEGLSRIGSDTLGASLTDRSLSNSMTITEEVDGSGLSRMTCSNIPIATTCAATSAIAIKIRR